MVVDSNELSEQWAELIDPALLKGDVPGAVALYRAATNANVPEAKAAMIARADAMGAPWAKRIAFRPLGERLRVTIMPAVLIAIIFETIRHFGAILHALESLVTRLGIH